MTKFLAGSAAKSQIVQQAINVRRQGYRHAEEVRAQRGAGPWRAPETDDELHEYIQRYFGLNIARTAVCPEHVAPFQFLADLYFGRVQRAVALGPRGGGKTKMVSILEWLRACHNKTHIWHGGGIEEQAKRGYAYLREYLGLPAFAGMADPRESLMSRTTWRNGSVLEIHAATMAQTSGPHPDIKIADELEKWRYDVYQQFLGMGTATGVQTVFISTREKSFGLMQQLLDEAAERDIKVYSWCVWETKAACLGGCKGEPCPLWEPCHMRYEFSRGHRSIENIIDKYLLSSTETWESQHLCLRPGSQGLCFPSFVTELGTAETSNVTEEATYNSELPIQVFCDDNTSQPRAILFAQEGYLAGIKRVWGFGEYYVPGRLQAESVAEVLATLPKKPQLAIVPAEATALKIAWHQAGIQTSSPKNYRRVEGVSIASRFIRDAHGRRVFLLHPTCKNFIRSIRNSHRAELAPGIYSDEPVKDFDDHGADATMYGLWRYRFEGGG